MAKGLNDIVKKTNSLADLVSRKLSNNAPKKTGNLQKAIRRANNINTMLDLKKGTSKIIPIQTITLTLDYAPDDAQYGMWWNDPTLSRTVKNGKTKNVPSKINFVEKTLQEPAVIKALNDIYDLVGDVVIEEISKEI